MLLDEDLEVCSGARKGSGRGLLEYDVAIKYGMAPNPDRHKIVFACAYKFAIIPLAGSCSTLVASCFPMEVRKFARAPARALDASHAAAIEYGMAHYGPHGQHGTVKGSGMDSIAL